MVASERPLKYFMTIFIINSGSRSAFFVRNFGKEELNKCTYCIKRKTIIPSSYFPEVGFFVAEFDGIHRGANENDSNVLLEK